MDIGIVQALGQEILTPLPPAWLGRADAPAVPPSWANIGPLSNIQVQALLGQIAYDLSEWDYNKIGSNNQLGRYQISAATLEKYGLLALHSTEFYGTDAVNYKNSWRPVYLQSTVNSYSNYFYNIDSQNAFLTNIAAQEHLAYQLLVDYYKELLQVSAISLEDPIDIITGMMYVAWTLGAGQQPTSRYPDGTGAYAWRYSNQGAGAASFNAGRYAVQVLAQ
ncbi:hypothetical protein UFOVP190_59 [uncultured Caudovirales phage]|uniref:Uncharacterized protein n=1 Tax=uncultured Caudovirales phage TaxID=2100421 RepID=A0A6J7WG29_9CAUD|nr:hypothetical protein UFOVP190_59 [uncultured Caudovirales phage]